MTTPQVTIPSFTIPTILVTLIIATLVGALAQLVVGYTRGGCLTSVLIGFIGALLGNFIASWLGMPNILVIGGPDWRIDLVWTFIGAAIFTALLALILGGSRYRGFYRRRYL